LFSIVLYLNDMPEGTGGETCFYSHGAMERDPQTGLVIGDPSRIVASKWDFFLLFSNGYYVVCCFMTISFLLAFPLPNILRA
jgi:hypothetical protein